MVSVVYDVVYDANIQKTCDVYRKTESQMSLQPMVVLIHGGAWMIGNKKKLASVARVLCTNLDVVCVVPEYSLSQLDHILLQNIVIIDWAILGLLCVLFRKKIMFVRFVIFMISIAITVAVIVYLMYRTEQKQNAHPAHANDLTSCVKFIITNAQTPVLNADANNIFLLGHSAGAHLACLIALNPRFLEPSMQRCIKGVIAISGVYCFWELQKSFTKHFINRGVFALHGRGITKELIDTLHTIKQCHCETCRKQVARLENLIDAFPQFYTTHRSDDQHKPAFLVLTSELDLSLLSHAKVFVQDLKKNKFKAQWLHFDGTNHFSIRQKWDSTNKHIADQVQKFISFILRPTLHNLVEL
jgi:acetyl esterase/lipase